MKTETRIDPELAVRVQPFFVVYSTISVITRQQHQAGQLENIQDPQTDITPEIHGSREDLACLRAEVGHKFRFTAPALASDCHAGSGEDHPHRTYEDPLNSSQGIADDSGILEQFLTDLLNFLIAWIALWDGQRADMLTGVGRSVRFNSFCHGYLYTEFTKAKRLHITVNGLP
jgi:hypothetical protein